MNKSRYGSQVIKGVLSPARGADVVSVDLSIKNSQQAARAVQKYLDGKNYSVFKEDDPLKTSAVTYFS